MSFTLKGHREMERKIKSLARQFPDKVGQAIKIEAEKVMTDSKQNYVPVDTGTLRSSGYVGEPERKGKEISITLGYGGAASDYAIVQHENPNFVHPVGSWKYLEKPLRAALKGMHDRIAQRLNPDSDKSVTSESDAA